MSRVFISESTGAAIYVFSDDHCPPHVHARRRGEDWIARVRFSYLDSAVELMSIAPLKHLPLRRTLNHLLTDVELRLPACRRSWWVTKRTTCLANLWSAVPSPERIEISSGTASNAKQISAASYDPDQERLQVSFRDGTTVDMSVRQ